jgi:hypothetical protein
MWTALHWVQHRTDRKIDMAYIFDQQRPSPEGIVDGGLGKMAMYARKDALLRGVEFACEPFNKLFWDLWALFAGYLTKRWEAGQKGDPGEHP